ncbi:MAG: hypothetical protein ACPG8W_23450 [Candidatus Promineifilaceae bacterium]
MKRHTTSPAHHLDPDLVAQVVDLVWRRLKRDLRVEAERERKTFTSSGRTFKRS